MRFACWIYDDVLCSHYTPYLPFCAKDLEIRTRRLRIYIGRVVSNWAIHWEIMTSGINDIRLYRYHILPDWMSYEHKSYLGHDLLWDILRTIRHFWLQNLRFRSLVLRNIILGKSYKNGCWISIVWGVSSCAGQILFCTVLDCHEQSDTGTAVPPVAALLTIVLPAVTSVHSCNS